MTTHTIRSGLARARSAIAGTVAATALVLASCAAPPEASAPDAPARSAPAAVESSPGRALDPPAAGHAFAPNLATDGEALLATWLERLEAPAAGGAAVRHRLRFARLETGAWRAPVTVAEGDDFFANWADFPEVVRSGDGSLLVHWLAKTGEATYAYSVFVARSTDGGATWAPLGPLHDDATPTEHGFVSWLPEGDGARAFWLDGRQMVDEGPMTLRTALVGAEIGPAEVLDERVCDCCSTDAAATPDGPAIVYRDRSDVEVRDVAIVRRAAAGTGWTTPRAVHADEWMIPGCPVNGPEIATDGRLAAVAWFTGAGETPLTQVAFSDDGAATFGPPVPVDGARPLGRADVVLDGGEALVSWLAQPGETAAVMLRRVAPDGRRGEPLLVAETAAARASGFPRLERLGDLLYLAWVDIGDDESARVRMRELDASTVPRPAQTG